MASAGTILDCHISKATILLKTCRQKEQQTIHQALFTYILWPHLPIIHASIVCYILYMTQFTDEGTFTSNGVTKKLMYIAHYFFAFEARDLILTFSENSPIMYLKINKKYVFFILGGPYGQRQPGVSPKIGKICQL